MLKKVKEYFLPWLFGANFGFHAFCVTFSVNFPAENSKRKTFVRGKNLDKKCRKMLAKTAFLSLPAEK